MKKTSERNWAFYFDGETATITDKSDFYKGMKGVIIPISADVAAEALMLVLSRGASSVGTSDTEE